MDKKRVYLTWDHIEEAVDRLATSIKASGAKIKTIRGLPRGGLIPAVLLSHKLNIPMGNHPSYGLIVDDICDSGVTLKPFMELSMLTATIHYKKSALVKPSFWYDVVEEENWIVYPWEQKDSETIQNYLKDEPRESLRDGK